MNELFVNVKVDREERPDLDRIYQLAHQVLTQRGRRLAAHHVPDARRTGRSSAGTYFPPERVTACRPSARSCERVVRSSTASTANCTEMASRTRSSASCLAATRAPAEPLARSTSRSPWHAPARGELRPPLRWLRRAPKFPHPSESRAAAAHWTRLGGAAEPDLQALYMATLTLTRMAEGRLYDQLGGGFCRYSVDASG
jgi:uncharacterized protein YyaL (SSP411 family)